MAKGYWVVRVDITDPEQYKKYIAANAAPLRKHGGRFLVRGGAVATLEGAAFNQRLVVIEFPSMEAARKFYDSPEYRAIMPFRQAAAEALFVLAEGVPDGEAAPDDRVVKTT
jgi:uncharacterized protein (DUF1330 family)